ncbi:terminase [Listeria newyorkensis]|uniref:Terminase n=2 Tax=Listeria newyorkensis TaxID=1497681 RepID=A0ABX4XJ78_9LIST|nr:terminase [Listeria newyorkensis]
MPMQKTINIQFNSHFKEFNSCKKRYRIGRGSAGSGKSVNTAQDYIAKLSDMRYKGANLLCVRKIDVSNRNSTFAELKKAINETFGPYAKKFWYINESNMLLRSLVTGNEVIFRGVRHDGDREKLKSITFSHGKLTWVWIEEATELLESDVDIIDDRLRGILDNPNLYYQITMTFNPVSSTHFIKRKYFDITDPDVFTHHSTYKQNRFIDAAYDRRMERRKRDDPEGYKVYGLGEWGELEGLVFKNFVLEEFDYENMNFDTIGQGQDFGFNHANAILKGGMRDGDIYIFKELYVHEMDTDEIIKQANAENWDKRTEMACDSAEPDRIKQWRKAGYNVYGVQKANGSVKGQIDWLKQRRVFIHPDCIKLYTEMSQWKWKKDKTTNKYIDDPVPFFDDAIAALRYLTNRWRLLDITASERNNDTIEVLKKIGL